MLVKQVADHNIINPRKQAVRGLANPVTSPSKNNGHFIITYNNINFLKKNSNFIQIQKT